MTTALIYPLLRMQSWGGGAPCPEGLRSWDDPDDRHYHVSPGLAARTPRIQKLAELSRPFSPRGRRLLPVCPHPPRSRIAAHRDL